MTAPERQQLIEEARDWLRWQERRPAPKVASLVRRLADALEESERERLAAGWRIFDADD